MTLKEIAKLVNREGTTVKTIDGKDCIAEVKNGK